ncbi:MAG: peptidylprolyl isomerase [Bacilli bacterium]|nr:peptidylprolyl isomerase [Bacilli bacterium]
MKKIIPIIVIILVVIIIVIGNMATKKEIKEDLLNINYDVTTNEATLNYDTKNPVVAMYIKNYGSIVIELYPDVAPNTVNNFISLVKSGFYDNNTFHRLVEDFVLQGGDPTGTGTGDPGYSIKGEFTSNGIENKLKHTERVVSMARGTDKNSAGSQFFIMLGEAPELDGDYAAFGRVIDGWDNILSIVENEKVEDEKLKNNLTIVKALVDTKGKSYKEPEKIKKN